MVTLQKGLSMSAKHTEQYSLDASRLTVLEDSPTLILLTPRLAPLPQVLAQWGPENTCMFYALSREHNELRDFLADLVEKCHEQVPAFGQQTLKALQHKTKRAGDLADAFVSDLAAVEADCNMLILDHFDNLILDEETLGF